MRYPYYSGEGKRCTARDITELVNAIYYSGAVPVGTPPVGLSSYRDRVPLYDIRSDQIWPVHWENVYQRVVIDDYRFLTEVREDWPEREKRIASWYDLAVLEETYYRIFYTSFTREKGVTACRKPSYYPGIEHITPYYTVSELLYLAYDWNLLESGEDDPQNRQTLDRICPLIAQHDIAAQTLIDHQEYIYRSGGIGLVKYYSLFGSYYIGRYLRRTGVALRESESEVPYDPVLEGQITAALSLLYNAPPFTSEHTVYRFVTSDSFYYGLQPGDIWTENSFTSTTRNPFYYQDQCPFGSILVRIKLPAGVRGVGLCIESYSNFPKEEEIILAPTNQYRLVRITTDRENSTYHSAFRLRVVKKYDFVWVGQGEEKVNSVFLQSGSASPKLHSDLLPRIPIPHLDLEEMVRGEWGKKSLSTRLTGFAKLTNGNGQFTVDLDGRERILTLQGYNSAGVYKPYFWYEREDGIMITAVDEKMGNLNLLIEVGDELHVNYYFRWSATEGEGMDLTTPQSVRWMALLALCLGCRKVVYHSDYALPLVKKGEGDELHCIVQTRHTYPLVVWDYLREGRKYYEYREVTPGFDYYQLDMLRSVSPSRILNEDQRDDLFALWKESGTENCAQFWIWLVENWPDRRERYETRMDTLYTGDANPLLQIWFTLDPWTLALNSSLISSIPGESSFPKKISTRKLLQYTKIVQFQNRLRNLPVRTRSRKEKMLLDPRLSSAKKEKIPIRQN